MAALADLGVQGLELAPTKVWQRPTEVSEYVAKSYRTAVEQRGLRIVAFQAILFGRPELTLFENDTRRAEAVEYLAGMCRLAGWLGARVLVFGSPKNRLIGSMPSADAQVIARDFFRRVGDHAVRHDTAVCIEANPPDYGCDFVTHTAAAAELVRTVNHPGFGLHLDAGGITLARDALALVRDLAARARHYHISEPHLVPIGQGGADHATLAAALRDGGYDQWLSVEMKPVAGQTLAEVLVQVAGIVREQYGEVAN